ncbi:MAG: magnesium transporter MgtE [Planctomycetes bacterium RBG_13_62_9]|nr:MAG: magnesium transporter MgtE [Planctomycetes bacterium RBG_13_62_9]
MAQSIAHLDQPVTAVTRKDFVVLRQDSTVQQAMGTVRQHDIGEGIIYFYVVDADDRLVGVVPTRHLLLAGLEQRISDIMIQQVITIPHTATVLEACEFFVMHRLLAFPVVDEQQRLVGLVDVTTFTEEVFDIAERERTDEVFELIGFRISQVRGASSVRVFRHRFPWLLATISSGVICALLASVFEVTLAQSIVLAFFLTLILGLGESVSSQSMAVTIQALRATRPKWSWYVKMLQRELSTAVLLGGACGGTVVLVTILWRRELGPAMVIGASIFLSLCCACLIGVSVPTLLHALRLDPKIAAGPLTLALADIFTLLFYFSLATIFL